MAERGLEALARNRCVVVPPVLYRSTALSLRPLPHGLLSSVLRRRPPFPDGWQDAPGDAGAVSGGPAPLSSAT